MVPSAVHGVVLLHGPALALAPIGLDRLAVPLVYDELGLPVIRRDNTAQPIGCAAVGGGGLARPNRANVLPSPRNRRAELAHAVPSNHTGTAMPELSEVLDASVPSPV